MVRCCFFAFLVIVLVGTGGHCQDVEETADVATNDGAFLSPTAIPAGATVAPAIPAGATVADDAAAVEEDVVVQVSGDLEGRVIDVVELAPEEEEELVTAAVEEEEELVTAAAVEDEGGEVAEFSWGASPTTAEEMAATTLDDSQVQNDATTDEAIPEEPVMFVDEPAGEEEVLTAAEEEERKFVTPVEEGEEVVVSVEEDDVFRPEESVEPFVDEETVSEIMAEINPAAVSLLESAVSEPQGEVSAESTAATAGVADPREGICTAAELDNVKQFFTTNEDACEAYQCVADYNRKFFESLLVHYNQLWAEGGDGKVNSVASLLSACTCRCDMMKCEVDFMKSNSSPKCFESTVDYCETQNGLFVERCEVAATQYIDSINEVAPEAKWNSECPSACSVNENISVDPIAGLTLDPMEEVAAVAGEGEEEALHLLEVPSQQQPGVAVAQELVDRVEEHLEGNGVGGVAVQWWMVVGCVAVAVMAGPAF
eukprot:GHVS01098471.1.p1 GENE.GHVS01098471.1~~GHVS01098471.1.p1  ORF type:complete len:485 (-),score=153.14 GHVS01098471.1:662-2116(-)